MDSRLRGNDGGDLRRRESMVAVLVLRDNTASFPRRRESIGHHRDPHGGAFLESTESSMSGSIFSGTSN